MTIMEPTHRKVLVMILGVAMVVVFGSSLAYAQTTQAQNLSQSLPLIHSQGFQMNNVVMVSIGNGGIGLIGMCHGNMTYS